jgi:hypothetical protein
LFLLRVFQLQNGGVARWVRDRFGRLGSLTAGKKNTFRSWTYEAAPNGELFC